MWNFMLSISLFAVQKHVFFGQKIVRDFIDFLLISNCSSGWQWFGVVVCGISYYMGITRALFLITPPVLSSACLVTIFFQSSNLPDVFCIDFRYIFMYTYIYIFIFCNVYIVYMCIYCILNIYVYIHILERFNGALSNLLNCGTWIEDVLATDKAVERYGNQMSSSHCTAQGFAGNVI